MTWLNEAEVETKEQRELKSKIAINSAWEKELQKLLDNSDHKLFADYEPKKSDNLEELKSRRSAWRAEIRKIQDWLKLNTLD